MLANIESLVPDHGGWAILKIVAGAVMLVEGAALVTDWERARRGALDRLLAALKRRGRLYRWLLGPVLLVFGCVSAGFGVLELVRGTQDLI